jgi:hypothetical protein
MVIFGVGLAYRSENILNTKDAVMKRLLIEILCHLHCPLIYAGDD